MSDFATNSTIASITHPLPPQDNVVCFAAIRLMAAEIYPDVEAMHCLLIACCQQLEKYDAAAVAIAKV